MLPGCPLLIKPFLAIHKFIRNPVDISGKFTVYVMKSRSQDDQSKWCLNQGKKWVLVVNYLFITSYCLYGSVSWRKPIVTKPSCDSWLGMPHTLIQFNREADTGHVFHSIIETIQHETADNLNQPQVWSYTRSARRFHSFLKCIMFWIRNGQEENRRVHHGTLSFSWLILLMHQPALSTQKALV